MAAISAAMSTLVHIVSEDDIRRALTGVPLFTHTMVAFCATFLLKIAAIWARGGDSLSQSLGLGFNLREIVSLTRQSADMLSEVADQVSEKHLTRLVVSGIREMLNRVEAPGERSDGTAASNPEPRLNNGGAAADFASMQMSEGADGMIYNMDLHSLAGLLEYGSDQYLDFTAPVDFDSWGGPTT